MQESRAVGRTIFVEHKSKILPQVYFQVFGFHTGHLVSSFVVMVLIPAATVFIIVSVQAPTPSAVQQYPLTYKQGGH